MISRNDRTVNVSRDDQGEIKLDCQDHSISFSLYRLTTPESDEEKTKIYEMTSDVMSSAEIIHLHGWKIWINNFYKTFKKYLVLLYIYIYIIRIYIYIYIFINIMSANEEIVSDTNLEKLTELTDKSNKCNKHVSLILELLEKVRKAN